MTMMKHLRMNLLWVTQFIKTPTDVEKCCAPDYKIQNVSDYKSKIYRTLLESNQTLQKMQLN